MRTLFEEEEQFYYEAKWLNNFLNNCSFWCESNVHKNRNLSIDNYFNNITPYMRNLITNLQNSDA